MIDALADSFSVTQEPVGGQFFRAMTRQFVRANPPRSPVCHGSRFQTRTFHVGNESRLCKLLANCTTNRQDRRDIMFGEPFQGEPLVIA
ncbi:MAG: putative DNA-binding domain-containing protein [Candidatus Accumulibacter phosphatis]|uniref:DUF2063 domain-containing protein n=1 Tax=Candidatus Accumulibacter contiguus TaxID=2954381 RepID=A0ABX1TBS8_9PROT|nr:MULTISPECIES: putative DNA-binding domain-containing protein [Candidatus Accumulibacter]MBL8407786.1 putative DNA-binding domain-containing protein [Accumulibacter sp.]NMQ06030.1 DUF2063 domain-containing protein [Candidatus Accumulibacter contiguus]HCZ13949.1 hypothetical protein [Accumulibacter sp.]HRF11802.1 putative DNA-binding domain-containing protein [Candidatus Accumulibacter phosphatis]